MHPLDQAQPYPFEQWWIAAYSFEIGRTIVARTILGSPIILYRTEDGEPVALQGYCPHRSYPLADGILQGDAVQCPYHGLTFAADGRCIRIPSQDKVPSKCGIRSYPCVERGGFVWVWTGSIALADPELLPSVESMGPGNPDWANDVSPMVTIKARYTLLIDNLLDLSHVTFIHSDTIPGAEALATLPVELIETEASINAQRTGRIPPNPLLALQFPEHEGFVEQHFDAEYLGPSFIRTGGHISSVECGRRLGTQNFIHGITPETPTSVHYFVITSRDFAVEDQRVSDFNLSMGDRIQPQDIAAIEAIERMLQALPEAPSEISVAADSGALRVRKRLRQQIAAESQTPSKTLRVVDTGGEARRL